MAKKYRRIFYGLFAWPSVEHLSGEEQLDMLTADMGDDGPIKAAELKVYDTTIILNRILNAARQEIQTARGGVNTPSWLIPLMDRIVTLASTCLECEASPQSPQREALPMLMLKLGRLIEAADLGEPFSDGLKSMAGPTMAASARHKDTNAQKAEALSEWDCIGHTFSGMAAFARHKHKNYQVTERTLYGWVRDHRKAQN